MRREEALQGRCLRHHGQELSAPRRPVARPERPINNHTTNRPPPGPQTLSQTPAILGLWIASTQDVARIGNVMAFGKSTDAVIGRAEDCTFPLDDDWISRRHVRLVARPGGGDVQWLAEDLGASNGTWVNGQRLNRRQLQPGDTIRLGSTVLVFGPGIVPRENYGLVGLSEDLHRVREAVERLEGGVDVAHITGETGTGKELVAQAIHANSGRSGQLLTMNMATIVPGLAESQLFGHRRGAFSGATADQAGAFDIANGGTLVLDEIAELQPELQAKLLRAVQFGEIHRIGDSTPHKVDVQLVTSTHQNLAQMVAAGRFREDLYWRLASFEIETTPLHRRRLDVAPLMELFLRQAESPTIAELIDGNPDLAYHAAGLMERAICHQWPGNVRELRDESFHLARAVRLRLKRTPTAPVPPLEEAFSRRFRAHLSKAGDAPEAPALPLSAEQLEALFQRPKLLRRAIGQHTGGNIRRFSEQASAVLGTRADSIRRRIYRRLDDT